jgi:hypothetical protein
MSLYAVHARRAVDRVPLVRFHAAILASVAIAGCANGPTYWTKSGATPDGFLADHKPCFQTATIGYGVGNEEVYKRCMRSKGWTRVQGTGGELPSVPYFRGPEDDDEFVLSDGDCGRWRSGLDRHRPPPKDC